MGKNSSEGNNNSWLWVICAIVVIAIVVFLLVKGCGTKEYKVSFDAAGGTAVNALTVKENGTLTKPSNPTRDGYEFAGWYLNGELFDWNTKITSDMTLEARWNLAGEESQIILNSTRMTLNVGDEETLEATLTGDIAGSSLVWSSSDESVATVENGRIKALKEGSVTITVKTADGAYSASCSVTVSAENTTPSLRVTISGTAKVNVGSTTTLKVNVTPKDTEIVSTTWKSNSANATVDKNGVVTGVKAGSATITVTVTDKAGNTKSASVKVTINAVEDEPVVTPEEKPVTGVKLDKTSNTITSDGSFTLKATILPEGYTDKNVKLSWNSSDTTVATVSDGKVTAKKEGTTTITVTVLVDGKEVGTATCKVTVKDSYTIEFTEHEFGGQILYYTFTAKKNGKAISGVSVEFEGNSYTNVPWSYLKNKPSEVKIVIGDETHTAKVTKLEEV